MRLWTFQHRSCIPVILNEGVWYAESALVKRVKSVDLKYRSHATMLGRDIETAPIYCFASLGSGDILSLQNFIYHFDSFNYFWQIDIVGEQRVMIELEIPEQEILNVKDGTNWFIRHMDNPDFYNTIFTSDYKTVVRRSDVSMEALIPSIQKKYVVCYREIGNGYDGILPVDTYLVNPNKFPLWVDSFRFRKDKRVFETIDGFFKELSIFEKDEWIALHGMNGCPRYYTVYEALCCSNKVTQDLIYNRLIELGIDDYISKPHLVMDLFPDGLFPVR